MLEKAIEKQSIADYRVYLKDYPNSEKMVGKQTINLWRMEK